MLIHLEKLGKSFGEKVVLHDVTASVEREDRIGIVGQNGAGKTTLLKILTGEYQDYEGEFSVTHGVTLGYLEQNAKLDPTLDIYGEMRATFAPVLDAMAQMQVLERKMAAQPDNTDLLAQHDALQNIVDAADGYNMDVNIKKVLSGMGFAQDTWEKNIDPGRAHEPPGLCHHGMAGKLPQGLLRRGAGGQPRPLFPGQCVYQDLGGFLPDHDYLQGQLLGLPAAEGSR